MRPEYRNNRDDAPRPVAAMAKTYPDGGQIPLHIHKRGQLIHAVSGTMKVETARSRLDRAAGTRLVDAAGLSAQMAMRGELAMRTIYIDPKACHDLPQTPMLVEVGGLMRELILAALEEPLDYDEAGRGGLIAHLILAELGRMQERTTATPDAARPSRGAGRARTAFAAGRRRQPRRLGRARGREPPHTGEAVSGANRLQLQRMARAASRHRRTGTAVEWRSGRQPSPRPLAMRARAHSQRWCVEISAKPPRRMMRR